SVRRHADLTARATQAAHDRRAIPDRSVRACNAQVRSVMTSARVNLLPHREERRKAARQHFYVIAGGTAVVGALIVVAMHGFYAAKIEAQDERNRFLKS